MGCDVYLSSGSYPPTLLTLLTSPYSLTPAPPRIPTYSKRPPATVTKLLHVHKYSTQQQSVCVRASAFVRATEKRKTAAACWRWKVIQFIWELNFYKKIEFSEDRVS